MTHWFGSGQIAYCVAGLTVFELLGLAWLRRLREFLPTLLAGDFLLLAWAQSAHWPLAAAFLLGSLTAHVTDMQVRGRFFEKKLRKKLL